MFQKNSLQAKEMDCTRSVLSPPTYFDGLHWQFELFSYFIMELQRREPWNNKYIVKYLNMFINKLFHILISYQYVII